ncbi:MAG: intradiol ring-cleavage dioxygenase [Noviherbaspirillum sp.]
MTTKSDPREHGAGMTRRKAMLLMGGAVLAARAGVQPAHAQKLPACIVTPEQTEGPYFVDERLHRADLRSDPTDGTVRTGVPLALTLHVLAVNAGGCAPLAGATVDVWHCDANGLYSDVADPRFDTTGKKFLRGYQITDASGTVRFQTIYPGWYPGRTVHIHFKLRGRHASGRTYEFTSQLYFDDAITDRVLAQAPYARNGMRRQTNDADGLFRRGGRQLLLPLVESGAGYAGSFDVGVRMS